MQVCSLKTEYFARKPTPEVCLRVSGATENRLRPLFRGMCVYVGLYVGLSNAVEQIGGSPGLPVRGVGFQAT